MTYVSLYRKWRPQGFNDVIGQDSIVKTLENSLNSGRISHAYLFSGPRGTGKTTIARILAKGLNCQNGPTSSPCGTCSECDTIVNGASLNVIEIDGASNNSVDDVRELREQVQFTPVNAEYKVYIIDEVHMLSTQAFNALLKTLEEPPAHVVFIFATTDPHRLPATILSRVQRYDFQRFTEQDLVKRLETVVAGEGFSVENKALQLIAQHANGGMRDALGILEKCAAFTEKVSIESVVKVLGIAPQEQLDSFVVNLLNGGQAEALQIINTLYNQGKDLNQFILGVITELRQSILVQEADEHNEKTQLEAIRVLQETVREMRFSPDPRISLELATLKITSQKTDLASVSNVADASQKEVADLEAKVALLEKRLEKILAQKRSSGFSSQGEGKKDVAPKRKISHTDEGRSDAIKDMWSDFLQMLRTERLMQCEAFLKEGSPYGVSGDEVIVTFPRDRGFHKASIEQNTHREPAERVLAKLMGGSLQLKCVFADEVSGAPSPRTKKSSEPKPTTSPVQAEKPVELSNVEQIKDDESKEFIDVSLETFGGKIFTKPKEK